jgi:tetratricopeptide (TPR) repeat protein
LQNRNEILANNGFFEEAVTGFENELAVRRKLANDFPNLPYLKSELVRTQAQLGKALDELGRNETAIELLETGIGLGEELVRNYPHTVDYLLALSFIYKSTAMVRKNSRNPAQVERSVQEHQRTYELYGEIVKLAPENADYQYAQALAAHNFGLAVVDTLDVPDDDAADRQSELLIESEVILKSLLDSYPENSDYQYRLAMHQTNRAKSISIRDPTDAADLLTAAAEGFERLIAQLPESVRFRFQLVRSRDAKGLRDAGAGRSPSLFRWRLRAKCPDRNGCFGH